MDNYLMHEGVAHDENPPGRGSGRYPFGSGERPHQHAWDLKARYAKLHALVGKEINPDTGKYYTEKDIAKMMGFTHQL